MVSVQWLVAGCRPVPISWQQGMGATMQHPRGSHPLSIMAIRGRGWSGRPTWACAMGRNSNIRPRR